MGAAGAGLARHRPPARPTHPPSAPPLLEGERSLVWRDSWGSVHDGDKQQQCMCRHQVGKGDEALLGEDDGVVDAAHAVHVPRRQ
eukprot:scaffold14629_cov116-Isochrysis_galbana.AAC.2